MLRESSIRIPRTFCCGTAAETTSVGRERQRRSTDRTPRRRTPRTTRSRGRLFPRTRAYVTSAGTATTAAASASAASGTGAPKARCPFSNTTGRYLNRNSKSD
jgi:hypothetical protein